MIGNYKPYKCDAGDAFTVRSTQTAPETHVRGHSKRVCRKEATKMMKRGKEELPW